MNVQIESQCPEITIQRRITRGGKRKQKLIKVSTGHRPIPNNNGIRGVNILNLKEIFTEESPITKFENLINIKPIKLPPSTKVDKVIDFCLYNVRSVVNKSLAIRDFIIDNDLDLIALTETWLTDDSDHTIDQLTPEGYSIINVPREDKVGGGIALLYKSNLNIRSINSNTFNTFEKLECTVTLPTGLYTIVIIYRPPCNQKNGFTLLSFLDEFEHFLSQVVPLSNKLIITGDFNIPIGHDSPSSLEFEHLLQSYNMKQLVTSPTHDAGNILDLIITNISQKNISAISLKNPGLSDHSAVLFQLADVKPDVIKISRNFRNIKDININSVKSDLKSLEPLLNKNETNMEGCFDTFNKKLHKMV
jgi:exonuclease III